MVWPVLSAAFDPTARIFAFPTAGRKKIQFYSVQGKRVGKMPSYIRVNQPATEGGSSPVFSFSKDGKHMAIGTVSEPTISVVALPVAENARSSVLIGHTDVVQTVCFSPANKYLASTAFDGTL